MESTRHVVPKLAGRTAHVFDNSSVQISLVRSTKTHSKINIIIISPKPGENVGHVTYKASGVPYGGHGAVVLDYLNLSSSKNVRKNLIFRNRKM